MTDFEDLQDMTTKEEIMNKFFTWLFDDVDVKDKSVILKSEVDLSLAHDYFDPKIYFPEQIYRFFQTPAMRRLGRISQLSLSVNEFPNTYHDRLEHSKGVYNRKLEEMIYNFKSAEWRQYIESNNLKLYLIAELIKIAGHDIGHFPFSHAMEEQLCGYHGAHEIIGQKIMLEDKETQDVLISISPKLPDILKNLYEHDFLNFRLHDESSYDVDRVDYISRDSLYVGSPVNIKTLPYTSIPYVSHIEPFVDAYSHYSLSDIENLLNLREYGYDTLYMSENEQASECVMSIFFKQFLASNSSSGKKLRNFLNSFESADINNINIDEFLKWDDISVYKELLDIAQHHEDENIRKLATLIIPRIDTFLNLLYSMIGCKEGKYSKEDAEFLTELKSIIRGNSELIADLSNPNFMSDNIISLKPSPLLEKLKDQSAVVSFDYNFKTYNPKEPIYILSKEGNIHDLSEHPDRTREWKDSSKKIHYDFTYVPLLKMRGFSDDEIEQIKNNSTLDKTVIPPEKVNMSPLQVGHNMKDYFSNIDIDER